MTLVKLCRNPKIIIAFLVVLAGGAFLISRAFPQKDIGDLLPPEEAQRYTYAFLCAPEGYFLAKLDLQKDCVVKKYPIPEDVAPSTVDKNGNLYLQNFGNLWSRDKVFVFYPKREKLKRILKSEGLSLLKVFSYKDKLYVLCTDQREGRGKISLRGSGLEIYDLATKKHIKTIYLGDYGTTTQKEIWVSYKDGLFISFPADMQIQYVLKNSGNKINRLSLHVINLDADEYLVNRNLDDVTMSGVGLTYDQGNIFFSRGLGRYYEEVDYKKHYISSLMKYSLLDKTFKEIRRFKNKEESMWYMCCDNNKLYMEVHAPNGFRGLRIVDCKTGKTLKEMPFWSVGEIVKVGQNKLYFTAMTTRDVDSDHLYVFDTQKDQIVKIIPGYFLHIAQNAWFY